jgi:hypothetical protein
MPQPVVPQPELPKIVVTSEPIPIPVRMEFVQTAMRAFESRSVGRGVTEYIHRLDEHETAIYQVTANSDSPINRLTARIESSRPEDFTFPPERLERLALEYRDLAIWICQQQAVEGADIPDIQ